MTKKTYERMMEGKRSLRDQLAIERTALANERTLLSYVRTMVGIMAIGGTLVKVFTEWYMVFAGWCFLFTGVVVLVVGFMRYTKMHLLITRIEKSEWEDELREDRLQHALMLALQKLHITS